VFVRYSSRLTAVAAAGLAAVAVGACGSSDSSSSGGGGGSSSSTVNGAGSTFAAPIYQQFGSTLKEQGVTVNYNPVGSGDGVAELTAGTVDFAGSDPPMEDSEVAAAKSKQGQDPVHVPVGLGAITVSYNLSGVKAGLKLDGTTIADIFLGKITKWNDPAITKLNAGIDLPDTDITVVHRSDESGTTKGFTGFLAASSPTWDKQVGADKTVKWPTGTGAKGNDGVAAAVKQTDGAVGYVEQAYALQNDFTFANVKNKSGAYVAPTLDSTTAAADGLKVPADLRFAISDPANPKAYPITSQTFLLVYKDPCKAGASKSVAEGLKKFLTYSVGPGQDVLGKLQYAKLPSNIDAQAKKAVDGLTCNGSPISG
jgi:phosphate transport system substrate-binding protein